jgi:hypothetical protein
MQFARVAVSLLFASALPHASAVVPTKRATICNGHAALCERSYGATAFVGAHNSYAVGTVNNLAVNQDQNITTQLNDGIRMLQMQAHLEEGSIRLCHTDCKLYNGGLLEDYLKTVKSWLDDNPDEVLSLLIANLDNMPAADYDPVFKAAGLDTISFAPETSPLSAAAWPTLGAMIDSGKRLVTFLDNGADPAIPYLLDEFSNVWETAFNVLDPAFDCNVNRTQGDPAIQLYLINHFLDKIVFNNPVPDVDKANVTNAATGFGSLGAHVETCVGLHTRPPNFMLVDFYEYGGGSVFEVAASINGVPYTPSESVALPAATPSSSGGSLADSASSMIVSSAHLSAIGAVTLSILFGAFIAV